MNVWILHHFLIRAGYEVTGLYKFYLLASDMPSPALIIQGHIQALPWGILVSCIRPGTAGFFTPCTQQSLYGSAGEMEVFVERIERWCPH